MGTSVAWRLTASIALATFWPAGVPSAQQNPPQFRAGVTLVPIEVRAIDKDGNPVTDLTAADFVIREAGRLQEVAHFRAVSLEALAPDTPGRTFLIVLGRGRLNQPTRALQALIDFVRSKSLPQDRIGVAAYLRVIEPTTDHDAVARFLETYRDRHETTDSMLNDDARHNTWPLPRVVGPNTRAAMDAAFLESKLVIRDLPGGAGDAMSRYNDFNYLRKALEYLRLLDVEKHAIMVSQDPFGMGLVHDDPLKNFWFRLATGARTALTYVHAGGITSPRINAGAGLSTRSLDAGLIKDYALVADQTGGLAAFYKFADQPLTALDRMTRHHYLLGYYPTQQIAPTEYRAIEITPTRPGVRLLYRHGYLAEVPPDRPDDYRRTVTETRLQDGAYRVLHPWPNLTGGIWWLMRLKAPKWTGSRDGGQVRVDVSFDPLWTTFVKEGDGYLTDMDLVLIADDAKRNVLSERRLKLNIRLSAAEFARTKREWLTYGATIDVKTRPAHLRAVLYDFEADRTASAQVSLLPPTSSGGGQ
jgi:VWFA-related protein